MFFSNTIPLIEVTHNTPGFEGLNLNKNGMFPLFGNFYGNNCADLYLTLTIKKPSIFEKDIEDEETILKEIPLACRYNLD